MRTLVTCAFVLLLAGAALAADGPELKTEEDKTLYALGQALSRSLGSFGLTEAELAQVEAGLADGVLHRDSKVDMDTYGPKIKEMQQARLSSTAAVEKKAGQAFQDKAAGEKGSTKTDSGVIITPIKPGSGDAPKATDKVKVHYTGALTDGTVFDSSVERGEPVTFGLNQVIPCWTEGLQHRKVGSKTRLVCPPSTAYGDRGAPPVIKPGATLVFEVELLEIVK